MFGKGCFCLLLCLFYSTAFLLEGDQGSLSISRNAYPIRAGYIDRISQFIPPERLASCLAVPGYADEKIYNYAMLGFWLCADQPTGAALVWSKPVDYFGDDSVFGRTKQQIQQKLHDKYNASHSHVLVSAFGSKEMPTSLGLSALDCASKLASFVLDNNLDGCDINWQDERTLQSGNGSQWLIDFHTQLRKLLPTQIITHSPSAAFFRSQDYSNHSYSQINKKINATLNFYNVQYFNLGAEQFNTYEDLFKKSKGSYAKTSVEQLASRGVDLKKIVVAKPVAPSDTTGSGWMSPAVLNQSVTQAYDQIKWFAGIALWQYDSDVRGKTMTSVATDLKNLCVRYGDCK